MINEIYNINLTHPFIDFIKSKVFLLCEIKEKQVVNIVTHLFCWSDPFIYSWYSIRESIIQTQS